MKAFSTNMIKVRIKNSTCRKKMFAQARNNNKRANIVFPALTKWFNNLLQIDIVGATKKVEELFPSPTGGIRGPLRYFRGKKNAPDVGSKKFKALYAIHRFANKDFYFNIDDNVGRFHSNLTNIKRELRHFITYDGQKLVNIDIKSAQPVFSTLLLSKVFYQKSEARLSIFSFPVINSVLQSPLTSKSLSSSYMMLVKTLQYIDIQCIEYYCSLVYSGEFYEKLLKLIYRDKKVTKSQVKVDVYRVFFSKNRSNNPFKTNFKNLFPDVYRVFALFKRKDHTCLSRLLQSIESKIMIEYVAVRVAHERPEIPIFTIHDSMATTVGNEGYLIQVIKEEAFRLTGLKLKVGVEYWG
jgi:hypothetical protein